MVNGKSRLEVDYRSTGGQGEGVAGAASAVAGLTLATADLLVSDVFFFFFFPMEVVTGFDGR